MMRSPALLLVLFLGACALPKTVPPEQVYAAGLQRIAEAYIQPVSPEDLANSGLKGLTTLDQAAETLLDAKKAPEGRTAYDTALWLNQEVSEARLHCAKLAKTSDDAVIKAVFDGMLKKLDHHSHYYPPNALNETLSDHSGVLPAVEYSTREGIGILHLRRFSIDSAEKVRSALNRRSSLKGLVIDLRENKGGYLDQAVEVADMFLPSGHIATAKGRHPDSVQIFDAQSGNEVAPVPVVVLIDGNSASGAELLAAALQDDNRAVIMGSTSYGKGSVQTVTRLPNGGELVLTWAKLYAPNGYTLQNQGVVPTLCSGQEPEAQAASYLQYVRLRTQDGEDEKLTSEIRSLCPHRNETRDDDIPAAIRLLNAPSLYAQALSLTRNPTGAEQP